MTEYIMFDDEFNNENITKLMADINKSLASGNNVELHISSDGGLKRASNMLYLFIRDKAKEYEDKIKIVVCDENASSSSVFILRCILSGIDVEYTDENILLLFHYWSMDCQTRDIDNKIYVKRIERQFIGNNLLIEILKPFFSEQELSLLNIGDTICITIGDLIDKIDDDMDESTKMDLLKLLRKEA